MRSIKFINVFFVSFIALLVLLLSIKGAGSNPAFYQDKKLILVGGPFESSNSTSRYILTEAIAEKHTFFLDKNQAKFASPDIVSFNNKFFSIFMPGISFIGVPFYLLGKMFGMQQMFTYFSVTFFAFINMLLIARIVSKLTANLYAGLLAGMLFLFGTNMFSYALFYTQHATTVTILLLSILTAMGKRTIIKNFLFGALAGIGLLLDVPNVILLLPVGLYILGQHFHFKDEGESFLVTGSMKWFSILFGVIPFLVISAWYNLQTVGLLTKFPQSIGQSNYFSTQKVPEKKEAKNKIDAQKEIARSVPFNPREQIKGLYTLAISDERSWIYYSPIVLLGSLGLAKMYKKKRDIGLANALLGVILLDILLYSMFDDPWGGWAFGPRYLIPAAALLSVGLGVAIHKYKRNILFIVFFTLAAIYSLFINTLGALTTSAIPPKVEAIHLSKPIPYTFVYNMQLAGQDKISSFAYNTFFLSYSGWMYIVGISVLLAVTGLMLYQAGLTIKEEAQR